MIFSRSYFSFYLGYQLGISANLAFNLARFATFDLDRDSRSTHCISGNRKQPTGRSATATVFCSLTIFARQKSNGAPLSFVTLLTTLLETLLDTLLDTKFKAIIDQTV